MGSLTRSLYSFLGLHSFLIGMFPFYIPVYLYTIGFSLSQICCFIGLTGIGFVISLYVWDRICRKISLNNLIALSFLSEFIFLTLFFMNKDMTFIVAAGFFNGVFNCNFWMIQRLLFLDTINPENSGKKFGNFQIFVLIVLKIGILIGGALLEKSGYFSVYMLSVSIALMAGIFFLLKKSDVLLNKRVLFSNPIGLKAVVGYKDRFHSVPVFVIDGAFLYLESYFWVISLFIIVRQSYWNLGLLVILLMVIFGVIFVIIKNSIDRLPLNKMYTAAVFLYSLSWVLRGVLSEELSNFSLLLLLALITFCTSIFRLAFNKRFFDIAKSSTAHEYIFVKSYFSQFFLAGFSFFGFLFFAAGDSVGQLSIIYLVSAIISMGYLIYSKAERVKK